MSTLVLSSRGTSSKQRHFIKEMAALVKNTVKSSKIDRKKKEKIKELMQEKSCEKLIFLEKKGKLLFFWIALSQGPSIKFLIQNLWTSQELNLEGNCSKRCDYIVSFDESFDNSVLMKVIKQALSLIFGERSREDLRFDRIMGFSHISNRIMFRNYEIKSGSEIEEIGPRFILTPIKVLRGFMEGEKVYKNGKYLGNRIRE